MIGVMLRIDLDMFWRINRVQTLMKRMKMKLIVRMMRRIAMGDLIMDLIWKWEWLRIVIGHLGEQTMGIIMSMMMGIIVKVILIDRL